MILTKAFLLIVLSALCSGCGSLLNHYDEHHRVYGGIASDIKAIGGGQVYFLVDLPFSLVIDTFSIPNDWPSPNPVKNWKPCLEPTAISADCKAFIADRERRHS